MTEPYLLSLPPEIRNMIFSLALTPNPEENQFIELCKPADQKSDSENPPENITPPPLLLTCKRIHKEALPFFYQNSTFFFRSLTTMAFCFGLFSEPPPSSSSSPPPSPPEPAIIASNNDTGKPSPSTRQQRCKMIRLVDVRVEVGESKLFSNRRFREMFDSVQVLKVDVSTEEAFDSLRAVTESRQMLHELLSSCLGVEEVHVFYHWMRGWEKELLEQRTRKCRFTLVEVLQDVLREKNEGVRI